MNAQTVVERSEAIMAESIALLIGIEDALEAIGNEALRARSMWHCTRRPLARPHYDHACFRIRKHRTIRKAMNETRRKLDMFREVAA